MRILLITGPSGQAQGWGDMETTLRLQRALTAMGADAKVFYVESLEALIQRLRTRSFDIVWSSLYHVSSNAGFIGTNASGTWVHDILDRMEIPYVGSGAVVMRQMLNKAKTIAILAEHGIEVPWQCVVEPGADVPDVEFPAFVKPCFESESTGVAEASVVESRSALVQRVAYVHREFAQTAVVEEYLPGREFTVSVIGNGTARRCYAVENVIKPSAYSRFPVVTKDLKLQGALSFRIPHGDTDRLHAQAAAAAGALGCADHVRLDVRGDARGRVKVIEINGIPGLNPINSRSLVIYGMYHQSQALDELFQSLIERIAFAALARYNLVAGESHAGDLRRSYQAGAINASEPPR
jgi:D-alanine-D-alanine ligase